MSTIAHGVARGRVHSTHEYDCLLLVRFWPLLSSPRHSMCSVQLWGRSVRIPLKLLPDLFRTLVPSQDSPCFARSLGLSNYPAWSSVFFGDVVDPNCRRGERFKREPFERGDRDRVSCWYIYIFMTIHLYTYIPIYLHTALSLSLYIYICNYTYFSLYIHTYIYIYIYIYVYRERCMYVCIYLYMYVCMYVCR